ncbi:molybdopterin cofactor-binding domain-containing protein [Inhella proteolytica]|uniref:Molybdopterin-dependent oxidoreductase n=1 Tax=Inhella proteolytica TaxID=2795029 RepID=A0A931J501_9BURK|nr:molybdopterin cofactor-binding domain-containing protein [Inhella proteolytica]MBH9576270.1 molybdopterin-dependent oxidoreductase [Inhella proteolytica]
MNARQPQLPLESTEQRTRTLVFWVNDQRHVVENPDPRMLLLDYLRSPEVGLTGTKKVCAQGGCGACTVTLSRWNPRSGQVEQRAINSCLRPLCAVDGMAITTVEGVGKVATGLSPVQYTLALNNGTQCGYCTPGWVMSMHSQLVARPDAQLTQAEIEALFDGNLCRCTGFRPILYAMRHFAAGWSEADERGSMRCQPWPGYDAKTGKAVIPIQLAQEPNPIQNLPHCPPVPLDLRQRDSSWRRVLSLAELEQALRAHPGPDPLRLVMGNTSIGIYGEPAQDVCYGAPFSRIDISEIPELHGRTAGSEGLVLGAATTYTELLEFLDALMGTASEAQRSGLTALRYMAQRTAGRIVRDAASLGGNTMLVVQHVEDGVPFPSDLFTALCGLDAEVDVACPNWSAPRRLGLPAFAEAWRQDPELQRGAILLRYHVPYTAPRELMRTFKVALREINAHSIVNAGLRVRFGADGRVEQARVVYGGIGPIAFQLHELEQWLQGQAWNAALLAGGLQRVRAAVRSRLEATRERMAALPDEGFTDAYRSHLAESFFYQFFIWVAEQVAPESVPPALRSAGQWPLERPVSRGTQAYQSYPDEYPVNRPYIKAEAFIQVSGEAVYTHDEPLPRHGVEAAPVLAIQPLARFSFRKPGGGAPLAPAELAAWLREQHADFVDLVSAQDVPGRNNQAYGQNPEDPLICQDQVTACGQVLALVLARTAQAAINIAYRVQQDCVAYAPLPDAAGAPRQPLLSLEQAIEAKNFLVTDNIWGISRDGSQPGWQQAERTVLSWQGRSVACQVVKGEQMSRCPQMHFYLETQSALATPNDNGSLTVISSTQNPDTILSAVSAALGLASNQVDVQVRRVGGGYGGKGPRSPWAAANAAVAAHKLGRPVKLAMTREADSALFGHESPLFGRYAFAIGTGEDKPEHRGLLMGLDIHYFMDAGNTADCTPVVMDCVLLRADNGYYVPHYETKGEVCLTNLISNSSFRSLDAISGIVVLEDGLEAAAHAIGMLPEEVREKNLYRLGDFTPYGQVLEYCYLQDVWQYAKQKVDFARRLEQVRTFNRNNRWRKRGISMLPIKYGMGFNATFLERGDALVDIFDGDGTVVVRHGGCEIGQGLNTQVMQLVAEALNIPVYLIRVGTLSTQVIPNPISTGASTGSAFNGGAAQKAAQRLRKRLEAFCVEQLNSRGRDYCRQQHLDFWSYDEGWNTPYDAGNGQQRLLWQAIVAAANMARVNLSAQAQHNESGGERADTNLQFHPGTQETAQNFVGFTYSVGCSEVEVDILTGETTILRSDLIYDMGKSLNPATDVGQLEGAFVQGIGRVLMENVVWQPDGPQRGMNNTPNTWGYKIPASTTIPREFHVDLYPRERSAEVPENPNLLMSAKEVGEPPLCLAATVYFALKHAILDSRSERGLPGWFRLDMPCTVQTVREACAVEIEAMGL